MSNAPYLLAKARNGYRVGHDRVLDHMLLDGLEDAYEHGRSMGDLGEATAEAYQLTAGTVSIASATTPDRQSVRSNANFYSFTAAAVSRPAADEFAVSLPRWRQVFGGVRAQRGGLPAPHILADQRLVDLVSRLRARRDGAT